MSEEPLIQRDARISECGQYRYTLRRRWTAGEYDFYPLVFVMLNPSTADASVDDPTIRRCMHFARREHCTALLVVNLFAFRATSPADLKRAADPVGPNNDNTLESVFLNCALRGAPVVAAWGAHGSFKGRDKKVCSMVSGAVRFKCLGRTKDGAPKHPLYLSNDAPLTDWRLA